MSTFNAINFAPHDELVEAEEHSRELQIEEGFKIYQDALLFLNEKKFEESGKKFEELFTLDVTKPDKWGVYRYSSPTLNRLRYLAYRNRGMYYYTYLLENYEPMDSTYIVNNILKVVENLIEAIQHDDPDTAVTKLLVQVFRGFKSKRLERLVLENELTKEDNKLLLLGRRRHKLLPHLETVVSQYCSLLKEIDDNKPLNLILDRIPGSLPTNEIEIQEKLFPLNHILDKIKQMKTEDELTMKKLDVTEINLKRLDWENITSSIRELLQYTKLSNLLGNNSDPYNELEEPIEAIKFVVEEPSEDVKICNAEEEFEKEKVVAEVTNPDTVEEKEKNTTLESSTVDGKNNKRNHPDSETAATRIVQRTSKRFKDKDSNDGNNMALSMIKHKDFFYELKSSLSKVGYDIPIQMEDLSMENVVSNQDLTIYNDMYDCLKNWSSWHTEIFSQNDSRQKAKLSGVDENKEILQLNTLLKSSILEDKNHLSYPTEDLPTTRIKKFIDQINSETPHFHEVRFLLLETLLNTDYTDRLISKYMWSRDLFKSLSWLVLGIEKNIYYFISCNLEEYWYLGMSIFEILVDMLGDICNEISAKRSNGNKLSDLKSQRNKLERKIKRWSRLLMPTESTVLKNKYRSLYFAWANYCFIQLTHEITSNLLINTLKSISLILKDIEEPVNITYPNYKHIPTLSTLTVQSQLNKINIIRNITLFESDESSVKDTETIKHENLQHITLIENILLKGQNRDIDNSSPIDPEMVSFVSSSPLQLKIRLWNIPFSYYADNDDVNSALRTYFNFASLLYGELFSDEYNKKPAQNRKHLLLTVLSSVGQATSKILPVLDRNKWRSDIIIDKSQMNILHSIFMLFYSVLYYESIATTNTSLSSFFRKALKSSAKMKDYILGVGTLVLYFFNFDCLKDNLKDWDSLTTSFIWNIHNLVGSLSFCDAAHGYFLILSENLLCKQVNSESYTQLKQILWCRYHYVITGDSFNSEQHDTKETEMSKRNSLPLGIYLMKLQYQKTNPLLTIGNKTSFKQVLDNIIESIGDPSATNNHILARNNFLLKEFLDRPITSSLLKQAFSGQSILNLTTPNDDYQEGMDAGIFYVASIQSMNLYRSRKKLMQARPSELDSIRRNLRNDILYNTVRFESWYMLGKCFSYVVEDDLIWTSDKISVIEKKRTIAAMQRKAILCYLMSLSVYYSKQDRTSEDEEIIQQTLEALGRELISGYYKPMDKLCFVRKRADTILELSEEKKVIETNCQEVSTISDFNVEQAIMLCFARANEIIERLSNNSNQDEIVNWSNNYHIGRMLFKINMMEYGKQAFRYILKSCITAAKISTNKDSVIEPHYFLLNMCYKMTKSGLLSVADSLDMLSSDNEFLQQNEGYWNIDIDINLDHDGVLIRKALYKKIVELLRFLIISDKKKLHHRPQFRIASILFEEFDDVTGALSEMENLLSIKNTKNIVNIWKPEYERPGKHFVYAYEYIIFYITLLLKTKDFNSIAVIVKKIRRFGAGIAYVNEATDYAIKSYNECVNLKLAIDDKKYIENLLPSLNYQRFLEVSEQLYKTFDSKNYSEEYLDGLKYAYQLKKGNNGIAFDGICLSLYFMYFYLPKLNETTEEEIEPENVVDKFVIAPVQLPDKIPKSDTSLLNSPKQNSARKRVSKKEAFDRIKVLIEKCP